MTKNKTLHISFRSSIPKWIGKVPFWHVIQSLLQKTVAHPLIPRRVSRKVLVEEGPMQHIKEKESKNGNDKERARG